MHLDDAATRRWLADVARRVPRGGADLVVLPDFTAIDAARTILAGTGIRYGAQDCCWTDGGAYTGEVSPRTLRALGCGYVEVGHAERRRYYGESDDMIAGKAAAGARNGLVPIVCVGEDVRVSPAEAGAVCAAQLVPVLAALPREPAPPEVIVAYEPVWAIGAAEPAPPGHIDQVVAAIRRQLDAGRTAGRVIYGGSAGPGLFGRLHGLDGLFLGRSALDVGRFAATVAEVTA